MTEEERASKIIHHAFYEIGSSEPFGISEDGEKWLNSAIAAAIREAVEAEREAWISNAASTAVTPTWMHKMGMSEGWDEQYAAAHSNAIYFLLSSMGLSSDEIKKRFSDAE